MTHPDSAPVMVRLLDRMRALALAGGPRRALLVVCPNSGAVIEAAVSAAARHQAPLAFTATLNQVDEDGGYTGMTHRELAETVRRKARELALGGPVSLAVDHGGPFLKDRHRIENWPPEAALAAVRDSFAAAIRAGFDLIHVDCSVDPGTARGAPAVSDVAERTAALIADAETFRREGNYPPVAYEVGTEEHAAGLADPGEFRFFLGQVREGLNRRGLSQVPIAFAVGDVGTDLHTTGFDPDAAGRLAEAAEGFGCGLKGHYTDNLEDPAGYPAAGVAAANVGPEFSADIESAEVSAGRLGWQSGMADALVRAVVDSGRWRKWLLADEKGMDFEALKYDRRDWLVRTGSRYVWTAPAVVSARERLYENLRRQGIDAADVVRLAIERSMDRYFLGFGLTGLNPLLEMESG
ncbi:MAG: class II D-tagatose-bisphosphate aldolase non-catalytic subunit [Desulfococcaceae bacterium]